MNLKLARSEINAKPKVVSIKKIEEEIESCKQKIFYFDKENSHKDMLLFVEHFEKLGFSVYHRSVQYGLNENDYMYEVHIL